MLTTLLSVAAAFALLVIYCIGLTAAIIWLFSLQTRAYIRGLQRYLIPMRKREYRDAGLKPKGRLLKQLTHYEAVELLSCGGASDHRSLPRWSVALRKRVSASLQNPEVMADMQDEDRRRVEAELDEHMQRIESHWVRKRLILACLIGIAVAGVFEYDLIAVLSAPASGVWPLTLWPYGGEIPGLAHIFGMLLTGLASGAIVSAVLARRMEPIAGRDEPPAAPPVELLADEFESSVRIGRPKKIVRAINFSAGGFDGLMQLGVVHALTVIQGRAPDVVVGLSVGAVNAVTLAEVVQAGEAIERERLNGRPWSSLSGAEAEQLQRARLIARVERLRAMIEAAHRAPERLLDALLPDAYQVDDSRPLAPLRQPRFAEEEREQRTQFVSARSGLARLYNHLLDIPISFGTLVKVARRVLGIKASGEIPSFIVRWAVRLTEGMRLWILLGMNLVPAATLVPILWRPYAGRGKPAPPANAAALIFHSRFTAKVKQVSGYAIGLTVLLFLWYVATVVALPFGIALAVAVGLYYSQHTNDLAVRTLAVDAGQGAVTWIAMTLMLTLLVLVVVVCFASSGEAFRYALREHSWNTYLGMWAFVLLIVLATLITIRRTRSNPRPFMDRLLGSYDIGGSIFRAHGLRAYLAELFDPNFYNKPPMQQAVATALRYRDSTRTDVRSVARKKVSYYLSEDRLENERIYVGLAVANTEQSLIDVVPAYTPLIDGLMASTAIVPFLPPVELRTPMKGGAHRKVLYIDGSNVSHEPTHALLKLLRKRRHPAHGPVHIYSVTPFPMSKPELRETNAADGKPRDYLSLLDITWRAMRLQRFRDASLERRLTELLSSVIPEGQNHIRGEKPDEVYIRAWVTPIELDQDADINRRIWGADKVTRRRIIEETIADGCRAALEVMIPHALRDQGRIKCRVAVARHFDARTIPTELKSIRLPGSEAGSGPGLPEICANCSLNRRSTDRQDQQALRLDNWQTIGPTWPHEREQDEPRVDSDERFRRPAPPHRREMDRAWQEHMAQEKHPWPRDHVQADGSIVSGKERPTVSLLFSGGVFRGVFQLGVLNGLNEVGIKPDLIAGASVGSITAALIARAFSIDDAITRRGQIARLAAVYLAIDRLILTDRFADFVRNLTIRAAETRFSIRQADRVFRKYDYPSLREFDRNARRVIAGIERLLYVTPYHLNDIVRAIRTGDQSALVSCVKGRVQGFLDRMQIGEEALGAEALREIVEQYVIRSGSGGDPATFTTDTLREKHQIQFLATTTNLTDGRLDVLGEWPASQARPASLLVQALLASSAFPGVFRPRWNWELSGVTGATERYIDGGVMDNLPMDAIARFLDRAGRISMVKPDPDTPHLIVAASLEVRAPSYALSFTRERFKNSWRALSTRAKQLSYNTKLDTYEFAESTLRWIQQYTRDKYPNSRARTSPLAAIKLVSIKPNWLCGTFAFHPMLGFRRESQARSIAHGCATTLRQFAALKTQDAACLPEWGILNTDVVLPRDESWGAAMDRWKAAQPTARADQCWLREKCDCPFSKGKLREVRPRLEDELVEKVSEIHRQCLTADAHLRKI